MPREGGRSDSGASSAEPTRQRIEKVALSLLLRIGYEGTRMRHIAEAAGVTTPALYWHFSSKAELCSSVVVREYERFSDKVRTAVGPGSPDERLRAYVEAFVMYQLDRRQGAMGLGFDDLVASLPADYHERIAHIQRPLHDLLCEILTAGRDRRTFGCNDVTVTAFAITSMCNYVFTWYKHNGRLTAQEVVDRYAVMARRLAVGAGGSSAAWTRYDTGC